MRARGNDGPTPRGGSRHYLELSGVTGELWPYLVESRPSASELECGKADILLRARPEINALIRSKISKSYQDVKVIEFDHLSPDRPLPKMGKIEDLTDR